MVTLLTQHNPCVNSWVGKLENLKGVVPLGVFFMETYAILFIKQGKPSSSLERNQASEIAEEPLLILDRSCNA